MSVRLASLASLFFAMAAFADPAAPPVKAKALVISMSAYPGAPRLSGVQSGSEAVAAALEGSGFVVIRSFDTTLQRLRDDIAKFRAIEIDSEGVAFVYFGGHGAQVNGTNYLLPISFVAETPRELVGVSVSMYEIFAALDEHAHNAVFIDACRNGLKTKIRGDWDVADALVIPEHPPESTLVMFATKPGTPSPNPTNEASRFTKALALQLGTAGQSLNELVEVVRNDVVGKLGLQNGPWVTSSIGDVRLREAAVVTFEVTSVDDAATVIVDENKVLETSIDGMTRRVALKAGPHAVTVLLHNAETYGGGVPQFGGKVREGWSYALRILHDGAVLKELKGEETAPPSARHGETFVIATLRIEVAQNGTVTVKNVNERVWLKPKPVPANEPPAIISDAVPQTPQPLVSQLRVQLDPTLPEETARREALAMTAWATGCSPVGGPTIMCLDHEASEVKAADGGVWLVSSSGAHLWAADGGTMGHVPADFHDVAVKAQHLRVDGRLEYFLLEQLISDFMNNGPISLGGFKLMVKSVKVTHEAPRLAFALELATPSGDSLGRLRATAVPDFVVDGDTLVLRFRDVKAHADLSAELRLLESFVAKECEKLVTKAQLWRLAPDEHSLSALLRKELERRTQYRVRFDVSPLQRIDVRVGPTDLQLETQLIVTATPSALPAPPPAVSGAAPAP